MPWGDGLKNRGRPVNEACTWGAGAALWLALWVAPGAFADVPCSLFFFGDPSADALRSDPRFDAFLAKLAAE